MLVDIYPQFYGRVWRWLYHLFDQNALKRAEAIICISHTTQRDLIRMLGVAAERTQVIPIAADPVFQPLAEGSANSTLINIKNFGLTPHNYLLFVGGTNPRKNLKTLLEAFQILRPKWPELRLVVVGVNAGHNKSGSQAIASNAVNLDWQAAFNIGGDEELKAAIVAPGYVSQTELIALYNGATALVFPSLYEGFGLPPLEAMACGCPVVAANTGALPEVVGEAALLCDPTQPKTLAAQLEKLLSDPHLRLELRAAGFEQTKKFDWLTTANRTLQLLRKVAASTS
jgi:alpha-1,3-rhamnosyl/mannosyltransferase